MRGQDKSEEEVRSFKVLVPVRPFLGVRDRTWKRKRGEESRI
jgi:hypothetical protein